MNKKQLLRKYRLVFYSLIFTAILSLFFPQAVMAAISGECSNCHTMHNSQNNAPMATYGATGQPWKGTGPFESLTRGDCLGCHGIGTANIVTIGGSQIPQVYHTAATDLAGGNFAYIIGTKGSGASDAKGHNVIELGNNDDTLNVAPGYFPDVHDDPISGIVSSKLTCAGNIGCHGNRGRPGAGMTVPVMSGAHHQNADGQLDQATDVANSYRFLNGVKGYEDIDWQATSSAADHNEYFGAITPADIGCSAQSCHPGGGQGVKPPNNTMSGFCATCHGSFHVVGDADPAIVGEGIGGDIVSPFTRHPTDIMLPNSGEYANYNPTNSNLYSLEAPVARPAVPGFSSSSVTPGTDAIVMCLSCHRAHASDFPDMLRWDYSTMIAGGGGSGGCFTCHTAKN